MLRAIGIGLLCAVLGAGCGPTPAPPPPGMESASEPLPPAAPAPATPPAATAAEMPAVVTQLVAETNLAPAASNALDQAEESNEVFLARTVPDDLLAGIIARFPFDTNECSDAAAGLAVPVTFKRKSAGYADGRPVPANRPRLVKGQFGNGLLLEDAHGNLLSRNQASAEGTTTSSFLCLKGTAIAFVTNEAWQGRQSLEVATPGLDGEEGVAIEFAAEKALYDGQEIAPAHYVASVYLKGSGALLLSLKEPGAGTEADVITLAPEKWQRFFCVYHSAFAAMPIGPGHEADWKTFLSEKTPPDVKLVFECSTVDRNKTIFYADGFQVEQRHLPFAVQGAGLSPRSWTPGGSTAAQDEFFFSTQGPAAAEWKQAGSVSFWFKPNWDALDGTEELLLYLGPSVLHLRHLQAKLVFHPAGVEFSPHHWNDAWHHLAVTWNEEGRRTLYVDGYDYANPREAEPIPAATDLLALSAAGDGHSPNGIIDELILFRGELSLEQIKSIAVPPPPAPQPAPTNDAPPAAAQYDRPQGEKI